MTRIIRGQVPLMPSSPKRGPEEDYAAAAVTTCASSASRFDCER